MIKICSLDHEQILYECEECPLCIALADNELKEMIKQAERNLYVRLYTNMQQTVNKYKDATGKEAIEEEAGTLMHWLYRQSKK